MPSGVVREQLVLYSVDLLTNHPDQNGAPAYTKEQLAGALDISPRTLDLYFTKLSKQGYINRSKKKYAIALSDSVSMTPEGKEEMEKITKRAEKLVLTPDRHNISSVVPLFTILHRIKDAIDRIFFLSIYISVPEFDLVNLLHTLSDINPDSDISHMISELGSNESIGQVPVTETFFRSCLFGNILPDDLEHSIHGAQDVNALLILAESNHRRGKIERSRNIYEHLLSGKVNLTKNQWYIANIGLAMTIFKQNRPIEAIGLLDEIRRDVDNPVMIAYFKQVKGRMLSDLGPSEEVLTLLDSAVRSFELQGIPLLCCISYNNRGVYYYRANMYDRAESDWIKAMKYAREAGSYYSEGAIRCNLSDIQARRKNFENSAEHLAKAREIFEERGDLEGIASVEYNSSLMYIEMGYLDEAIQHFNLSEEVALPLPTEAEKKERRNYFLRTARENGLPVDDIKKEFSIRNFR